MEYVVESIRSLVVMVLVMELVIQLSPAKQYEPYMKMLIGIIVVWRLTAGIWGFLGILEEGDMIVERGKQISLGIVKKIEEEYVIAEESTNFTENDKTNKIQIDKIQKIYVEEINPIKSVGGVP